MQQRWQRLCARLAAIPVGRGRPVSSQLTAVWQRLPYQQFKRICTQNTKVIVLSQQVQTRIKEQYNHIAQNADLCVHNVGRSACTRLHHEMSKPRGHVSRHVVLTCSWAAGSSMTGPVSDTTDGAGDPPGKGGSPRGRAAPAPPTAASRPPAFADSSADSAACRLLSDCHPIQPGVISIHCVLMSGFEVVDTFVLPVEMVLLSMGCEIRPANFQTVTTCLWPEY